MMKQTIIILIGILSLVSCSYNHIVVKELTKEKYEELSNNRGQIKCEQHIKGSTMYKGITEIENGKLNKLKRESHKCGCNTVYLDFNEFLGEVHEGEFFFLGICVNEKK